MCVYSFLFHKFCKLYKSGPIDQDVFQRNLIVKNPKQQDILYESAQYFQNTKHRRFKGDVLGYCTPVSNILHSYNNIVSYIKL